MSDKLSKAINEVNTDLNDDIRHFQQDFIAFRPKEFKAIRDAEKVVYEQLSIRGKGRVIALACGIVIKLLEDGKETKTNEKV